MAVVTGKRTYRPTKGKMESPLKRLKYVERMLASLSAVVKVIRKELKAEKAARKNSKYAAR